MSGCRPLGSSPGARRSAPGFCWRTARGSAPPAPAPTIDGIAQVDRPGQLRMQQPDQPERRIVEQVRDLGRRTGEEVVEASGATPGNRRRQAPPPAVGPSRHPSRAAVRERGLEPLRPKAPEPKSDASAYSATLARRPSYGDQPAAASAALRPLVARREAGRRHQPVGTEALRTVIPVLLGSLRRLIAVRGSWKHSQLFLILRSLRCSWTGGSCGEFGAPGSSCCS